MSLLGAVGQVSQKSSIEILQKQWESAFLERGFGDKLPRLELGVVTEKLSRAISAVNLRDSRLVLEPHAGSQGC